MIVFWILFSLALIAALSTLAAALRVWNYFGRPPRTPLPAELPGLSVLVPLKGIDRHTRPNLEALLACEYPGERELLLAMETPGDPAYELSQSLIAAHPQQALRIVLSGDPGERMGKQHNLVAALAQARYPLIASMDADVLPDRQALARGAQAAAQPGVGVAFSLPYYFGNGPEGRRPRGGDLVALYSNYWFSLYSGSLALLPNPAFTIGSLWFASRQALERIGGLEPFTGYVTDDAAIGRAVVAAGLRNHPLRTPASLHLEQLGFQDGLRHIQKWLTMLRSEGLGTYWLAILLWHPLLWGALAWLASALWASERLLWGGLVFVAGMASRVGSTFFLNKAAYRRLPRRAYLLAAPAYELLVSPVLFALGFFRRTLVWRGRRYRLGKLGKMLAVEEA